MSVDFPISSLLPSIMETFLSFHEVNRHGNFLHSVFFIFTLWSLAIYLKHSQSLSRHFLLLNLSVTFHLKCLPTFSTLHYRYWGLVKHESCYIALSFPSHNYYPAMSHPSGVVSTSRPSAPSMRGIEGPHRSMSSTPTEWPFALRVAASWTVAVLFPTPPFPDSTNIVCPTPASTGSAGVQGE